MEKAVIGKKHAENAFAVKFPYISDFLKIILENAVFCRNNRALAQNILAAADARKKSRNYTA